MLDVFFELRRGSGGFAPCGGNLLPATFCAMWRSPVGCLRHVAAIGCLGHVAVTGCPSLPVPGGGNQLLVCVAATGCLQHLLVGTS